MGAGSLKKVRCTLAIARRSQLSPRSVKSSQGRSCQIDRAEASRQGALRHRPDKSQIEADLLCLFLITTKAATVAKRLRREKASFLCEETAFARTGAQLGGRFLFAADRGCGRIFFLPLRVSDTEWSMLMSSEAEAFRDLANSARVNGASSS